MIRKTRYGSLVFATSFRRFWNGKGLKQRHTRDNRQPLEARNDQQEPLR